MYKIKKERKNSNVKHKRKKKNNNKETHHACRELLTEESLTKDTNFATKETLLTYILQIRKG